MLIYMSEDIIEILNKGSLKTPLFSLDGLECKAKCVKCYDADTIHIVIYINGKLQRHVCRLMGIDSAEIRSKNILEKKHAKAGRDFLKEKILDKIIDIECFDFDKYGRLLVDVYKDGENINNVIINKGYAYKYIGGRKKKFEEWCNSE